MRGASLRVRRRLLLPLLCGIAAAVKSDLRIYLADPASDIGSAPTDDTCTYSTAFGTMNAQSGCGIPVAIDGVAVNETTNDTVFIANGRNAIHIMTQTVELAAEGAMPPAKNKTVAIQISSYSSDGVVLCNEATVLREGYKEGLTYVPVTSQGDPFAINSDATIYSADQGNTLYVIPYALRAIRGPPYPELTIVIVPSLVEENIHRNCTVDAETSTTLCSCGCNSYGCFEEYGGDSLIFSCRQFAYEKYDPITFTVKVRTEPALEALRDELVPNCDYAYQQDHTFTIGGAGIDEEETSAAPRGAAMGGAAPGVVLAAAAVLLANRRTGSA